MKTIQSILSAEWPNNNKIRILIFGNSYFNKTAWIGQFRKKDLQYSDKFEIIFTTNRFKYKSLLIYSDVLFCSGLNPEILKNCKRLKTLYFSTAGLEFLSNLRIPDNIKIFNSSGISSKAIAEYTLTLALILHRRLQYAFLNQFKQRWDQDEMLKIAFNPFSSLKIGIVGVGNNGAAVAALFKQLGCHVSGCDYKRKEINLLDQWFLPEELDQMLCKSDIVILSMPLTKETKGLFDLDRLKLIGPKGYIINISRGAIIVEKDLIRALRENSIAGAAIDVFEKEPLPLTSNLWRTPNLIITPHISGNINMFTSEIIIDFIDKVYLQFDLLKTLG